MKSQPDILTPTAPWAAFEEIYLKVRRAEGRILSDDNLLMLPHLPGQHPLYSEWKLRAHAAKCLVKALKRRLNPSARVLEVGCGNGWLSHRIQQAGFTTTGIDVNLYEITQAQRVFANPRLHFAFADVFVWQPGQKFEVAVLASVLQYFDNPNALFTCLFEKNPALKTIIICDTQWYQPSEIPAAKQRSEQYYASLGFAEMAAHYHHHCTEQIDFEIEYLYHAGKGILGKLLGRPFFPIISIKRPC